MFNSSIFGLQTGSLTAHFLPLYPATLLILPLSFLPIISGLHVHTPTKTKISAEKCTHTRLYLETHMVRFRRPISRVYVHIMQKNTAAMRYLQPRFPHRGKMKSKPHCTEIKYIQNKMYPE